MADAVVPYSFKPCPTSSQTNSCVETTGMYGPVDSSLLTWLSPRAGVNLCIGMDEPHALWAVFHLFCFSQLGF